MVGIAHQDFKSSYESVSSTKDEFLIIKHAVTHKELLPLKLGLSIDQGHKYTKTILNVHQVLMLISLHS
jgi:hypothetical protein